MSLERQIKIKDKWCQLIMDLGFDYDGLNTVESLKCLIDELVDYAHKAIICDDVSVVYVGADDKKSNILLENIKE